MRGCSWAHLKKAGLGARAQGFPSFGSAPGAGAGAARCDAGRAAQFQDATLACPRHVASP